MDMEPFFAIHTGLPREGPGSDEATARAFHLVPALPPGSRILDIGCGPGRQTIALARLAPDAHITAIDTHAPFLERIQRTAREAGFSGRIMTVECSMTAMGFPDACFNLIWAEASIYNMGFVEGLRAWKRYLKPHGCVAVSEAVWLRENDPPEEVKEFWDMEYPAMTTAASCIEAIRGAGYEPLGHFTLPDNAWWDEYYTPMEARIAELRAASPDDPGLEEAIAMHEHEMDMHRRFPDWYGYEFFVMRLP